MKKHRYEKVKFERREDAKRNLKGAYTRPKSIAALRLRVEYLEEVLGVRGTVI